MQLSITKKTVSAVGVALTIAALFAAIIVMYLLTSAEESKFEKSMALVNHELQVIMQEPVFSYDKDLINKIISAYAGDDNISTIEIYDHRDKLLGSAGSRTSKSMPPIKTQLIWEDNQVIGYTLVSFTPEVKDKLISTVMTKMGLTMLFFALMCGVLVFLIIKRLIVDPLHDVNTLLVDVTQGNGDLTRRITYSSNDEIGFMVEEFNRFIQQVQVIIQEIATTSRGLNQIATHVKSSADQTSAEANEEVIKTQTTLSHLEQLNQATDNIAQNTSLAATNTDDTLKSTINGRELMISNLNQVSTLVIELDQTAELAERLHSTSTNISSVLDVIKSIAEQTNLLALNAAIEAARAGEQGRGFAVVADEVRTLAKRTQTSTTEIEDIIAKLQSQAGESVSATQRSKDLAQKVIESTQSASEALDKIAEKMSNMADMNNMIASASEEQSSVTTDVKRTMHQIHQGAKNISSEADDLQKSIVRLTNFERDLTNTISKFNF